MATEDHCANQRGSLVLHREVGPRDSSSALLHDACVCLFKQSHLIKGLYTLRVWFFNHSLFFEGVEFTKQRATLLVGDESPPQLTLSVCLSLKSLNGRAIICQSFSAGGSASRPCCSGSLWQSANTLTVPAVKPCCSWRRRRHAGGATQSQAALSRSHSSNTS